VTEAPRASSRTSVAIAIAVASGLVTAFAFPGPDLGILAFVSLVPLLWLWRDARPGRAALLGFVAGLAFFGFHLSWTWYFGAIAIVPLVALQAAFWAGAGAVVGTLARRGIRSPFLTAAVWVVFEAFRTRWPLGGLAWGQLGVALHDFGDMIRSATNSAAEDESDLSRVGARLPIFEALVQGYLDEFDAALETTAKAGASGESLLAVYIRLSANEWEKPQPSASWIFSAIAEDPDFLTPIKTFKRQLFERLKGETPDIKALLICYLAIEGLRSMNLFDSDVLSVDERRLLVSSLLQIAG